MIQPNYNPLSSLATVSTDLVSEIENDSIVHIDSSRGSLPDNAEAIKKIFRDTPFTNRSVKGLIDRNIDQVLDKDTKSPQFALLSGGLSIPLWLGIGVTWITFASISLDASKCPKDNPDCDQPAGIVANFVLSIIFGLTISLIFPLLTGLAGGGFHYALKQRKVSKQVDDLNKIALFFKVLDNQAITPTNFLRIYSKLEPTMQKELIQKLSHAQLQKLYELKTAEFKSKWSSHLNTTTADQKKKWDFLLKISKMKRSELYDVLESSDSYTSISNDPTFFKLLVSKFLSTEILEDEEFTPLFEKITTELFNKHFPNQPVPSWKQVYHLLKSMNEEDKQKEISIEVLNQFPLKEFNISLNKKEIEKFHQLSQREKIPSQKLPFSTLVNITLLADNLELQDFKNRILQTFLLKLEKLSLENILKFSIIYRDFLQSQAQEKILEYLKDRLTLMMPELTYYKLIDPYKLFLTTEIDLELGINHTFPLKLELESMIVAQIKILNAKQFKKAWENHYQLFPQLFRTVIQDYEIKNPPFLVELKALWPLGKLPENLFS